jgi:hypothetical protein
MATLFRSVCALVALVLVNFATPAAAQIEGPLDNDASLPALQAAEAELARGDFAFATARKLSTAADERATSLDAGAIAAWTPVVEGWRNALVRSTGGDSANPFPVLKPGDVSPWTPAEPAVPRFTAGVEEAVFRRIAKLPRAGQLAWTVRFASLALE